MQTTARYLDGVKFEIDCGCHRLVCDQPQENGGEGAGPSPPDFLLASLCACAAYYALRYLRARSLPAEGLTVQVAAEKALNPARLASFRIEIQSPELEERHREGLLRAVKSCLIHNTLTHPPQIETVVRSAAVQPAA